ncbi:MAG: hypothetical protein HeimC3_45620 [Candidatus Heimdallarchaeota archaeon LC_3]|nr:MAG: hypothetical protein HeimC3_45620 [Candidatus Heimdallarchaeota archaeon LC_3]
MISIINELTSKKKSITLYDIQGASGACVPDTMEAAELLSYLTSLGKIIETPKGWIRIAEKISPKEPRRYFYLKEILQMIKSLSTTDPLTSHQLADKIGLTVSEVVQYLQFFKEITSAGHVIIDTKGYPYNYYLEPYINVI